MSRILSASAAVENGSRTVTFDGPPLSDANCPVDGSVVLAGAAYFIASRTDTSHFELTRDYEGTDGTVSCEIDPLNANAINLVKVARQITEYNAKMALTDAYGKGLFYECLGFTGANDPGPGKLARNAASWSDTTEIYMDVLDYGGHQQGALIDLARANTVYIVRAIDTGAYAAFILSAAPANMGPDEWRKISLEYVDGDGIIADGELVAVEWNRKGEQGDSFTADAEVGTLAERDAFDDEAAGFVLKVNDVGDGRAAFYTMGTGGTADWGDPAYLTGSKGDEGDQGDKGWSPQLVGVSDGERRVMKLAGYVGGAGDPPAANVGEYLKADGTFTADIAEAMDIRGAAGAGNGIVEVINQGTGIAVDASDPIEPVIALADMGQATIKGRAAGAGTGAPGDLTAAQALAIVKAAGAFAKDNILGSVSQVSGVPTGAILERGSNANGQYIRYADGTQICWTSISVPDASTAASNVSAGPSAATWTFPSVFSAAPAVSGGCDVGRWLSINSANSTSAVLILWSYIVRSAGNQTCTAIAIGRWF